MNVAFIPVRGGSKSIPLKNIRPICGKPLVYWTMKAACGCRAIDRVYIATDSDEIRAIAEGFITGAEKELFAKAEVISRSAESASDTASTESAMLEFAEKHDFDNIVLIQATSRLLQAKDLDKAIEVYRRDKTPPKLIPSGGKGSDESLSEAEAMKNYLVEQGIPEEDIIMEDQSKTTFENLKFSKDILDGMEGRKYTALVTSNYHVYRALRYCKQVGLKCTGIGSRVAFYYWPSALIREFIAIHAEKKHAVIFAAGWAACMILTYIVMI